MWVTVCGLLGVTGISMWVTVGYWVRVFAGVLLKEWWHMQL